MKYLVFAVTLLLFACCQVYATGCDNLPDGWIGTCNGGEPTVGPYGPIIGYARVSENHVTHEITCEGKGPRECKVLGSNCFSALHNDLIGYAVSEIVNNNILSGNHNINMIIDGIPRYGYVTWSTNTTNGESTVTTTVN
jgi:hypothetical protein